ncbi:MAG: sigma-70 family RNA polymerase sigma factor [Clostridia bacterium]|nr:sigma-70 family RNA polymerase sigma factor [Clostridia bacterium]
MELTGNIGFALGNSREAVLSRWYDAYGTDVLRLCCFYLGSRADAEDATQETFLKAWKHMDRFQGRNQCAPKTWLMRIACNTCRDHLRRAFRKHEVPKDDLSSFIQTDSDDRELILDVMNLPEKYRAVILLFYLQSMTVRETARALHISPSTVCRRLETARGLLRN